MTDPRTTSGGSVRLQSIGLAIAVLVAALALVSAPVAAADGDVNVTRADDGVQIQVGESVVDGDVNATNATVRVNGTDRTVQLQKSNGSYTGSLPGSEFDTNDPDLSAVQLTVTLENGSANETNATLDLRTLALDEQPTMGPDNLTIPVRPDDEIGVRNGSSVPVAIGSDGNRITVNGTYDGRHISIPRNETGAADRFLGPVRFESFPDDQVVGNAVELNVSQSVTVVPGASMSELQLPLATPGENYTIDVETTGLDGRYRAIQTAGDGVGGGSVEMPAAALFAEQIHVTVETEEGTTVYDGSLSDEHFPERSTVEAADDGFEIGDKLDGNAVQAVWINTAAGPQRLDDRAIENGTLRRSAIPGDSESVTALLVGDSGSKAVELSLSQEDDSGESSDQPTETESSEGGSDDWSLSPPFDLVGLGAGGLLALLTGGLLGTTGSNRNWSNVGLLVSVMAPLLALVALTAVAVAGLQSEQVFPYMAASLVAMLLTAILWYVSDRSVSSLHPPIVAIGLAVGSSLVVVSILAAAVRVLGIELPTEDFLLLKGALLGVSAGGGLTVALGLMDNSASSGPATTPTTPETYPVTVTLRDSLGEPISSDVPVTLVQDGGLESETTTISGGSGRVELEGGAWAAKATIDGETETSGTKNVARNGTALSIEFPGRSVGVSVVDDETGSPVTDATLAVDLADESSPVRLDGDGRWSRQVSRSTGPFDVTLRHDRYEARTVTVDPERNPEPTISAVPLTGGIEATVTVGGEPVAGVPVTAVPSDSRAERFSAETGESGTVSFRSVPVGEYVVETALDGRPSQFTATDERVTVRDGTTASVDARIEFRYTLSSAHQRDLEDIRERAERIGNVSRRDGAIPAFYASVVESVLDTVASIPDHGHEFFVASVDPAECTAALLDAADRATSEVDDVMTSKRNVDLFSACTDLPNASVDWSGTVSVDRVLTVASWDIGRQRGEAVETLERVDDAISERVGELGEVSPAREMWEGTRDLIRDQGGLTPVESAATIVVAEALLDAIAALFEHDRLRERMERTVF